MTFKVRYTRAAREDLRELYAYQLQHSLQSARRARDTIAKGSELLKDFSFTCRKADQNNPFLRELLIPFGGAGYVALFQIDDHSTVTILAVRHQHEDDYL
ncbi:type II toxin-antitoxin system RelE/ParE family toxin [Massilia sp. Mn16-1_5]|uniref:type II toxin-antitoxin system RelE/ParE family toxin n=1 Tax=Massilia sp. Mn16-1_5 TaxID=2079199 RepID=UPI00109E7E26|nr:type II toxin-antitoxin system RelE/ParE family toxin [Massilia sp. Mn16-1_5]THC41133.1 plasmid stabilization protein [Massilia sp. Mn16-1_5]